jgi:hypothetical protein
VIQSGCSDCNAATNWDGVVFWIELGGAGSASGSSLFESVGIKL